MMVVGIALTISGALMGKTETTKAEQYDIPSTQPCKAEDNYNLLFIGPPASSKTLFLQGILEIRKDAIYFDGSNTTSRLFDVLFQAPSNSIRRNR
jgi:hypothetical protein